MLVDDEPLILQGLQYIIDWEEHGIELTGTACNGIKALELMKETPANIVITDIKMPKMDGLELIKELKSAYPATKVIILSGYNEFEYAKKALKLGVENYLLKPIVDEELSSTIITTIEKLRSEETFQSTGPHYGLDIIKDNILNRLVTGTIGKTELYQKAEFIQLDLNCPCYYACVIGYEQEMNETNFDSIDQSMAPLILKNTLQTYIYHIFSHAFSNQENAIVFKNVLSDTILLFASKEESIDTYNHLHQLLSSCLHQVKQQHSISAKVYIGSRESRIELLSISYSNAYLLFKHSKSPETIIDWMTEPNTALYLSSFQNTQKLYSPMITKVLELIAEKYQEEMSLKTISYELSMNAAYLGQLFKKETGQLFSVYLNTFRIEKAKKLLLHTDLKANEISEKVGFSNQNYFYNTFKKFTNYYPTEFKKSNTILS